MQDIYAAKENLGDIQFVLLNKLLNVRQVNLVSGPRIKQFMDNDFLLTNAVARELYHQYAARMPVYDYHCHLNPAEIGGNKKFRNLADIWLSGDHYKWRAMRSNGIVEEYITGDAGDYDKFMAWASTVPECPGNPLYHWTHLELQRYFGIYEILNEKTADYIWRRANERLSDDDFSARSLIKRSAVNVICTTDDPADTLEHHKNIADDKEFEVKVLPTFRPDKGLNIEKPGFTEWLEQLSDASGMEITDYDHFLKALKNRLEFFHSHGCRLSDHALDYVFFRETDGEEAREAFRKRLRGEMLTLEETEKYKTYTLYRLGLLYHRHDWAMQLHIGAMRNNNTRMFELLGPDSGYDSVNDGAVAAPLAALLNDLEKDNCLPRTILYCLNPKDNYVLATMLGNFQGGGIPGKIQFGSGWWFNDHEPGMRKQLTDLANLGLLGRFIGMLTDSRSFLSYTRHEYFRRILCNLLGEWVTNGELPHDMEHLGTMVQNICYHNAHNYFRL